MQYEKSVMSKKELMAMGFPESMLLRASREQGQTFAWRMNPANRTSPLLFDTHGFELWRLKQVKLQTQLSQVV